MCPGVVLRSTGLRAIASVPAYVRVRVRSRSRGPVHRGPVPKDKEPLMPLTIPAGDGLASIRFRVDPDPDEMVCTLGVRPVNGPLAVGHAARIFDSFIQNVQLLMPAAWKALGVLIRVRQDGGEDSIVEYVPTAPIVGTGGGAVSPPNVSHLIRKRTARAGKRGTGRFYWPAVTEGNTLDDGSFTAAYQTTWNNALAGVIASLGAAAENGPPEELPVIPLLFHGNASSTERQPTANGYTLTYTQGAAGPAPDVITALVIDSKVATQRRRLR